MREPNEPSFGSYICPECGLLIPAQEQWEGYMCGRCHEEFTIYDHQKKLGGYSSAE